MGGLKDIVAIGRRQTSADIVFDRLYEGIISLELLPGSKLSEVEVAEQFGISRQPVRDAFSRLGNMDLLLIQPQRATQVRRFSVERIEAARFARRALELEIVREAALSWQDGWTGAFEENLAAQDDAVAREDREAFHGLDARFHEIVAKSAGAEHAIDLVLEKKAQVDRICVLSLKRAESMAELVDDHRRIYRALAAGDWAAAQEALRLHLSRIGSTIDAIRRSHPDYFEAR